MTPNDSRLRHDLNRILRSAIDAVHAGRLVEGALAAPDVAAALERARHVDVIAAGKASGAMLNTFAAAGIPLRQLMASGPSRPEDLPPGAEWFEGGHPLPTEDSVRAARRALAIASAAGGDDLTVVLLSGGGSALMALPAGTIGLAEKQLTARTLMEHGADIHELNTVRKHLSAIKGGRLAAASPGSMLTLAVSDVVGDDLSVIASGPTVPDESTFQMALDVLARRGGHARYPAAVVTRLEDGAAGRVDETPSPGDPRLARSSAVVIGPQRGAIIGARLAAEALGYAVEVLPEPVTGEARIAGARHIRDVRRLLGSMRRPACILSSGETTVTVVGSGRGGRNQEFAFAMASELAGTDVEVAAASIGTDGIDGPTDAAGAIVDASTMTRAARHAGGAPERYLEDNNTYELFDSLGDLVRTGPTSTNMGDLQVVLVA